MQTELGDQRASACGRGVTCGEYRVGRGQFTGRSAREICRPVMALRGRNGCLRRGFCWATGAGSGPVQPGREVSLYRIRRCWSDRRPRTLCSIAPAGGAGQSGGTESRTSSARSPVAGSPRTIAQSTSSSRIRLRSADTARARLAPTTAPEIRRPPGRTWPRTSRFPSSCGAGTRHGPRRRRPTSHPYPAPGIRA
jgi:hypothetical protein